MHLTLEIASIELEFSGAIPAGGETDGADRARIRVAIHQDQRLRRAAARVNHDGACHVGDVEYSKYSSI